MIRAAPAFGQYFCYRCFFALALPLSPSGIPCAGCAVAPRAVAPRAAFTFLWKLRHPPPCPRPLLFLEGTECRREERHGRHRGGWRCRRAAERDASLANHPSSDAARFADTFTPARRRNEPAG